MKRRTAVPALRADDPTAQRVAAPSMAGATATTEPVAVRVADGETESQGAATAVTVAEIPAIDVAVGASAVMADVTNSPAVGATASAEDASLVKKRRTKNFKWREDMAKKSRTGGGIVTRVAPLEPVTFATWEDFIRAWTEYMVQTKTLYRRRSSCSTASWNSKNRFKNLPVPDSFQYATMAYWCTHGCIQPSRGTGVRAHLHNRFTGCTARVTADVVYEKTDDSQVRWFIRVRNQISQHNHRISDDIFTCYSNNSSVPDEMLLGPIDDVAARAQELQAEYGTADFDMAGPSSHDNMTPSMPAVETNTVTVAGAPFVTNSAISKEVLADEQKISMARSELQPLLEELRRTPSRVIHKRLQDVSEFVMHLVSKWEQDRANEDRHLHFIAQSASNGTTGDQQRLVSSRSLLAEEYAEEGNGEEDQTDGNQDDSPQHVESEVI